MTNFLLHPCPLTVLLTSYELLTQKFFTELSVTPWRGDGAGRGHGTQDQTLPGLVPLTRLLLRPWQPVATGGEGCPGLGPADAAGPAGQRWRRSWWSRRGGPRRRRGGRCWSRSTSLDHKQRSFTQRTNMLHPIPLLFPTLEIIVFTCYIHQDLIKT